MHECFLLNSCIRITQFLHHHTYTICIYAHTHANVPIQYSFTLAVLVNTRDIHFPAFCTIHNHVLYIHMCDSACDSAWDSAYE